MIAPLPIHLAVIMDGNGRWAERRSLPRWAGHRAGSDSAREVITHCARRGIAQLTLYAFSSDNWKRPRREVSAIMSLCERHLRSEQPALSREGIRTSVIGRRDRLPASLVRAIDDIEERTSAGRRMHLRIALDYSSRAAIAASLGTPGATLGTPGTPSVSDAPSLTLGTHGSTIIPPVDLLLRTGGERRLSDFLLWECAYAELSFVDTLWPDMTAAGIDEVLDDFRCRERRFGALPARNDDSDERVSA